MKQIQIVIIYIFLLLTTSLSLHAQTTTYHVNENTLCTTGCNGLTWATAFDHLQDALDAASTNDVIWVAEGTYRPTKDFGGSTSPAENRNKTFNINKDLEIYGGFPNTGAPTMTDRDADAHPTVLEGDLGDNDTSGLTGDNLLNDATRQDNAYTVVYTDGRTSACILSGFVIQNGNANTFIAGEPTYGGGIFNQSSNPSIMNCQFTTNSANSGGGGIFNQSSNPSLMNCQFTSNSADLDGGGIYNSSSNPSLTNCQFTSNSANLGGGISNFSSNPSITNCQFTSNSADSNGGGIFNQSSNPSLMNCQFTSNSSDLDGGGIYNLGSSPIVTNGSFAKNSAGSGQVMYNLGGGDTNPPSNPELTNCILWDNGGGSGIVDNNFFGNGTATTINYSIAQGGWTGAGSNNLDQDPQFIDAANNDLTLAPTSPAIDAGDNSADLDGSGGGTQTIADVPFDLAGNQRIVDFNEDNTATVDMGAFEAFVAAPAPEVPTLSEWGLLNLALLLMICGTLYLVQPMREVGK